MIGLIWAQDRRGVIGAQGGMPWHVPEDLAHFKQVTLGAPVIMGRRTWESLNPRFRPLPGRRNIVVTRQEGWPAPDVEPDQRVRDALDAGSLQVAHGLRAALALAGLNEAARQQVRSEASAWIIGGAQLFLEALSQGVADVIERTLLDLDVTDDGVVADTFAPELGTGWEPVAAYGGDWQTSKSGVRYRFERWVRV